MDEVSLGDQSRVRPMATAINGQVTAYADSVMAASREALRCWDSHKPVQEALLVTPGIVAAIGAVTSRSEKLTGEERTKFIGICKSMLESMTSLMGVVKSLREHEFPLDGLTEFQAAMSEVRFMLADLLDSAGPPNDGARSPVDASPEAFRELANEMPPSQSWFDENHENLRGPRLK